MNLASCLFPSRRLSFLLAPLVAVATLAVAGTSRAAAADTTNAPLRKGAILVQNRAGADYDVTTGVLEDTMTSRAAGMGIKLIGRQAVTDALDKNLAGTDLDTALGQQSSALRLAQNLDADFILLVSLASVGVDDRSFKDDTTDVQQKLYTLRASYKLLEAGEGAALAGDTVKASEAVRAVPGIAIKTTELYNRLAESCADQLLKKLPAKVAELPKEVTKAAMVPVTIVCGATDLTGQTITVPDLGFNDDGTVKRGNNNVDLLLSDVTIEINGVTAGSAPGTVQLPRGLNKMRLTREGFSPWERTVNFMPGQKLKVSLAMSPAGFERWKENIEFLATIEAGRKLTDAEVKRLEGIAQMFRQSGFKVDGKSLYDGATLQTQNNMKN